MDRGAWGGYSPWGRKTVRHDLATKPSPLPPPPGRLSQVICVRYLISFLCDATKEQKAESPVF